MALSFIASHIPHRRPEKSLSQRAQVIVCAPQGVLGVLGGQLVQWLGVHISRPGLYLLIQNAGGSTGNPTF
jgi:hypothetical protein